MPIEIDLTQHHPIRSIGLTKVVDCVQAAGFCSPEWHTTASYNKRFQWAHSEPEHNLYLFNLWSHEIELQDGRIVCNANWRTVAEVVAAKQRHKAVNADMFACAAHQRNSPTRVVILDGVTQDNGNRQAEHRNLDPLTWRVTHYCMSTGIARFVRGV